MTKKQKIIEGALGLLASNGIHATPMSAIAKIANTGMGTIYNYFPNKEALINPIYVDIKKKEEETLALNYEENSAIQEQFKGYYHAVISFFINNPTYFHFLEQLSGSPIITEESKKEGYAAINFVIDLLKSGQKGNTIKDIPIEELLQFIGGAVFSHLRWLFQENMQGHGLSKNQVNMVWDGIKNSNLNISRKDYHKKTALITGTSSGLGLEASVLLAKNDYQYYLT